MFPPSQHITLSRINNHFYDKKLISSLVVSLSRAGICRIILFYGVTWVLSIIHRLPSSVRHSFCCLSLLVPLCPMYIFLYMYMPLNLSFSRSDILYLCLSEVRIYKRKQESKKTRKKEPDQESDQVKKKKRKRSRKQESMIGIAFFFTWSLSWWVLFFLRSCFLL